MSALPVNRVEGWVEWPRPRLDSSEGAHGRRSETTVVAVVDTDDFLLNSHRKGSAWADRQLEIIENVISKAAQRYGVSSSYHRSPDEWMLVFVDWQSTGLYERVLSCVGDMQAEIKQLTDLTISIALSRPQNGATALDAASQRAQAVAMDKLITGGDRIIEEPGSVPSTVTPPKIDRSLAACVQRGDQFRVLQLVTQWIDDCASQPGMSAEQLQDWTVGQILYIMDLVSSRTPSGSADWVSQRPLLLRELGDFSTIHERSYLYRRISEIVGELFSSWRESSPARESILSRADEYMAQNFGDPALRLRSLAEALWTSPYHLSHLFQRERNSTFLRELTGLRMRAARQLLTGSDLSIATISQRTGYSSAKRFRIVFKREVGCSPTQYRQTRIKASDKISIESFSDGC